MALTLLELCQTALQENAEFAVPSTIVGNTDPTAVRLLAVANRTIADLRKNQNTWQALCLPYSFDTVDGTADYALPSDFQRYVNLTQWAGTTLRAVKGPVSSKLWNELQYSGLVSASAFTHYFRVFANVFSIVPTPTEAQAITYEYVSSFAVDSAPVDGVGDKIRFLVDTDQTLLDEDLVTLGIKWRFLAAAGAPFDNEFQEYTVFLANAVAQDGGRDAIDMGGPVPIPETEGLPETGFGV